MCGICGKLNMDFSEPVESSILGKMMALMNHRGPDGGGEYRSGPIGMGHRRLSIIDLSTGDQPMANEDGTIWVVYNGEIYNYEELRRGLQGKGHSFKSKSDTEVIIHLYEELGPECVEKFRGMFAFALWDATKRLLLIARDRVGIKPLYFTNTGKSFLFASEIKSLLVDSSVNKKLDHETIDRFLTYGYVPGNRTLHDSIKKLEPGHYLVISPSGTLKRQYWDLAFDSSRQWRSYAEATEALQSLIEETVRDHLISDVPVGVLLSGGVDSTGILRYAANSRGSDLHTFTIGFAGGDFADERPYARIASRQYGSKHQEISMSAEEFRDCLPKYVWHMEEPVFEPPAIALYYVTRLAQKTGVKVLLSGEGGDEAFGGYQTYRNLLILEKLKSKFGSKKKFLRAGFSALNLFGMSRFSQYRDLVNSEFCDYYMSRTETPSSRFNSIRNTLYRPNILNEFRNKLINSPLASYFQVVNNEQFLNKMLYVDTKSWLPDDLLVKADKMTMATSVELRVPLLDHRILEFAASLPPHFKVKGWTTKRVLKDALRDSVSQEILNRKKTGFPVPYKDWLFRRDIIEYAIDTIMSQSGKLSEIFDMDKVKSLLENQRRTGAFPKETFCLLVLGLWNQIFNNEPCIGQPLDNSNRFVKERT